LLKARFHAGYAEKPKLPLLLTVSFHPAITIRAVNVAGTTRTNFVFRADVVIGLLGEVSLAGFLRYKVGKN
jgi:hypothetical protein